MFPVELLNRLLNSLSENLDNSILIKSTDFFNYKIEQGEALFVSKVFTVANGASVYVHHTSGSTKYLHSKITADSVGAWRFTSYIGTTYNSNGTELTQFNRKTDSSYVPEVKFYENLVGDINVLGTPRLDFAFGSGTNPALASNAAATENEFTIFEKDSDVLVKLTNNSGSQQLLTVVFNYYET